MGYAGDRRDTNRREAIPLDKETNTFEKAKTQGEFTITLGDRQITLFSGVIPTEALALSAGPMYPCIAPGEVTTIRLGLQNNSQNQVHGEVVLHFPAGTDHEDETIDFQIDTKKAIELPVEILSRARALQRSLPLQIAFRSSMPQFEPSAPSVSYSGPP